MQYQYTDYAKVQAQFCRWTAKITVLNMRDMTIEEKASIARAMRAWLALDQRTVAVAADLAQRTLLEIERARSCSERSWTKLLDFYDGQGLRLVAGKTLAIVER